MPIMVTKLTVPQVKELTKHPDEDIKGHADRWLERYEEVEQGVKDRTNILKPAARLLTVDSQLAYILEEEESQREET